MRTGHVNLPGSIVVRQIILQHPVTMWFSSEIPRNPSEIVLDPLLENVLPGGRWFLSAISCGSTPSGARTVSDAGTNWIQASDEEARSDPELADRRHDGCATCTEECRLGFTLIHVQRVGGGFSIKRNGQISWYHCHRETLPLAIRYVSHSKTQDIERRWVGC